MTLKPTKMFAVVGKYPTEFRGCMWSDGWEFEAPCVVYFPRRYAAFMSDGNTGGIDRLVEYITSDIADGEDHRDRGLSGECEWRGWGKRFDRRRDAWHVIIKGHWTMGSDGRIDWSQDSRTQVFGKPVIPVLVTQIKKGKKK